MLHDAERIAEEIFFVDMDTKELWQLVEQDDETDAGLEAGEYRSGDQVAYLRRTEKTFPLTACLRSRPFLKRVKVQAVM